MVRLALRLPKAMGITRGITIGITVPTMIGIRGFTTVATIGSIGTGITAGITANIMVFIVVRIMIGIQVYITTIIDDDDTKPRDL